MMSLLRSSQRAAVRGALDRQRQELVWAHRITDHFADAGPLIGDDVRALLHRLDGMELGRLDSDRCRAVAADMWLLACIIQRNCVALVPDLDKPPVPTAVVASAMPSLS